MLQVWLDIGIGYHYNRFQSCPPDLSNFLIDLVVLIDVLYDVIVLERISD